MEKVNLFEQLDPISKFEINRGNMVKASFIGETRLSDGIKISTKYWECKYFFDENKKVNISSFKPINDQDKLPISLFSFIKTIKLEWIKLPINSIELIPLLDEETKQKKLIKILIKLGFSPSKNEDNFDCLVYINK